MTTYTLSNGLAVYRNTSDSDDSAVSVDNTGITLELVVPESTTSLSYTVLPLEPGDVPGEGDEVVDISVNDYTVRINGRTVNDTDFSPEFSIFEVDWMDGAVARTSTVLIPFLENVSEPGLGLVDADYIFVINGAPLPPITTVAGWNAFESGVTGISVPTGAYGPGTAIPLTSLGAAVTENDVITGTSGNDTIYSGVGNDIVNPLNNTDTDEVDLGAGTDQLILSDMVSTGYVQLIHDTLSAGITVNIDGTANTGSVNKGAAGVSTITDIQTAMKAGGVGVFGTDFNDSFTVSSVSEGFIMLRGEGGNDTFNVTPGPGIVRLDYRGAASGITADLGAGTVSVDGDGGSDTIIGAADELRGTMFNDTITGSDADERFILMAGTDTLNAGGGFDLLRYDRSGVDSVTLDLNTGIATGVWRGENFTHTISGIEAVRGSRDGNDDITGLDTQENTIFGGGGDDIIDGGDLNDSLYGGDGNDDIAALAGDDEIWGENGDDTLSGEDGNDTLHGGSGDDTLNGGAGALDTAVFDVALADATISFSGEAVLVDNGGFRDTLTNIERLQFTDQTVTVSSLLPSETVTGDATSETLTTGGGDDVVDGGGGDDTIDGGGGDDRLIGGLGDDTIDGGDGADTLNGGDGADTLTGGVSVDDLRDIIYGGDGDDIIDGGYGNDLIYGMGGNDTIAGGFGVDELQGQDGDDVITGSAFSDLVFGGDGNDFVNGGFGSDRINGGTGADKFFHLGVLNHGSDWVQDYVSADGDVLLFGNTAATADQFQVNYAHTANADGERAGDDAVQEAFVIYKPTGQIMWALIDGEGQDPINLQIAGASTCSIWPDRPGCGAPEWRGRRPVAGQSAASRSENQRLGGVRPPRPRQTPTSSLPHSVHSGKPSSSPGLRSEPATGAHPEQGSGRVQKFLAHHPEPFRRFVAAGMRIHAHIPGHRAVRIRGRGDIAVFTIDPRLAVEQGRSRRPQGRRRPLLGRLEALLGQLRRLTIFTQPAQCDHLLFWQMPLKRGEDAARMDRKGQTTTVAKTPGQPVRKQRVRRLGLTIGPPLVVGGFLELNIIPQDVRNLVGG